MSSKVHKVYAVLALSVVSVENTVPTKFDLRYIIPFGDKSTSVIYSSTKKKVNIRTEGTHVPKES